MPIARKVVRRTRADDTTPDHDDWVVAARHSGYAVALSPVSRPRSAEARMMSPSRNRISAGSIEVSVLACPMRVNAALISSSRPSVTSRCTLDGRRRKLTEIMYKMYTP